MNLSPIPGDRWTLTMEVLSLKGKTVTLRRGTENHVMPLEKYMTLAAATIDSGGELHRIEPETEEIGFE